jgi:hypothetical protein
VTGRREAISREPSSPPGSGSALPAGKPGRPVPPQRALAPVLLFVAFFYAAVVTVLAGNGLPFSYFPIGTPRAAGILLLLGSAVGPAVFLCARLVGDMSLVLRGGRPPFIGRRFARALDLSRLAVPFALIYLLANTAYSNLKPAVSLINHRQYDAWLESMERALFGGVLPTQWLLERSSAAALYFWDGVYGSVTLFMFVSVTIALHYEGIVGGSRLLLAYCIGLFVDVFFTLWIPSLGPIFVHPDWFEAMSGSNSDTVRRYLLFTVRQYADSPGTTYAYAGISAMPSYHVYAWACGLYYWRRLPGWLLAAGILLNLLNWISTVVLGWHYALDGLAGILLVVPATWVAARVIPESRTQKRNRSARDGEELT